MSSQAVVHFIEQQANLRPDLSALYGELLSLYTRRLVID